MASATTHYQSKASRRLCRPKTLSRALLDTAVSGRRNKPDLKAVTGAWMRGWPTDDGGSLSHRLAARMYSSLQDGSDHLWQTARSLHRHNWSRMYGHSVEIDAIDLCMSEEVLLSVVQVVCTAHLTTNTALLCHAMLDTDNWYNSLAAKRKVTMHRRGAS